MRISDFFGKKPHSVLTDYQMRVIRTNCSTFLEQSQPLLKNSTQVDPFAKIKIRFHNQNNKFIETFNNAFLESHNISNLHQRALFASTVDTFVPDQDKTPIFVFPRNGFKLLYNQQISNANEECKNILENLSEDNSNAELLLKHLLQYTYSDADLSEAINSKAEVILYNMPWYYGIRADLFENYSTLLQQLR